MLETIPDLLPKIENKWNLVVVWWIPDPQIPRVAEIMK